MLRPIIMVLGVATAVVWARRTVRHALVAGPSMLPTLAPGDRLVLIRTHRNPRVGQLVMVGDPRAPHRALLKRVHAVDGDAVDVRGDNAAASTDSRAFGTLPAAAVDACLAWRYAPISRVGLVGNRGGGLSASRVPADRRRSHRSARR